MKLLVLSLVLGLGGNLALGGDLVPPSRCVPGVRDYGFLAWAEGPPPGCYGIHDGGALDGRREILCVRTGFYGFALDVASMRIVGLDCIEEETAASEAWLEPPQRVIDLSEARWGVDGFALRSGDVRYRCVGRGPDPKDPLDYPVRMIESGSVFQRFDVLGLRFASEAGEELPVAGRLEVAAWPDRVCLRLELVAEERVRIDGFFAPVLGRAPVPRAEDVYGRRAGGKVLGLAPEYGKGERYPAALAWIPDLGLEEAGLPPAVVEVQNLRTAQACPVTTDDDYGWIRVELPCERWSVAEEPDRLERYQMRVVNTADATRPVRLLFAKDGPFAGITGMTAVLRDSRGNPTGIPVQLSKNWHRKEGRSLVHEGPWFHGFSLLRMPPRSETTLELSVAYARWGGVPAASHSQLCLVGWGHNQLWEEVAVGSWGESICYEPDAVQRRCRIDDVRPLMVWGMNRERARWTWTNNVGGGDFLVYFDESGRYRPLVGVKAQYLSHGPSLTRVRYAGTTNDGAIDARMTVETPRTDDFVRAFHHLRYDVRKPVRFQRLAFYQLGADHYLWFPFGRMAQGHAGGLVEEWTPELGGKRYSRVSIPCEGDVPWLSLHESVNQDTKGGAWANRGLIVRSWNARLGGRAVTVPHASVYGTHSGTPSASLELSAPLNVQELKPGDFVEADVELVVLPQDDEDYYGPNDGLRRALDAGGNTWRPVLREAVGNALRVRSLRGKVTRTYPVEVAVDDAGAAEIEITGGVGYVPLTFTGLKDPALGSLVRVEGDVAVAVDQSVHGGDFWQTDHDASTGTWSRTYTVPLDAEGDVPQPVRFRFR